MRRRLGGLVGDIGEWTDSGGGTEGTEGGPPDRRSLMTADLAGLGVDWRYALAAGNSGVVVLKLRVSVAFCGDTEIGGHWLK